MGICYFKTYCFGSHIISMVINLCCFDFQLGPAFAWYLGPHTLVCCGSWYLGPHTLVCCGCGAPQSDTVSVNIMMNCCCFLVLDNIDAQIPTQWHIYVFTSHVFLTLPHRWVCLCVYCLTIRRFGVQLGVLVSNDPQLYVFYVYFHTSRWCFSELFISHI